MIRKMTLAFSIVMIAVPALAQPTRPGRDRDCVRGCREAHRTCTQTALAAARMCADEGCSDELDAVRAACAADATSAECQAAREALRACVAPCREELHAALRECRAIGRECVAECPIQEPPPPPGSKDPACVAGCRTGLAECSNTEHGELRACVDSCQDLVAAARLACAGGRSEACAAARKAADDCLGPCNQSFREGTALCLSSADSCVRACPPNPAATSGPAS